MPVLAGNLLDERAVAGPDAPQEGRRLDAPLVHRIVEVVDTRHDVRPHRADDPLGVRRLPRIEQDDVGERGGVEVVQAATCSLGAGAGVGQGLGRRDPPGRDGEHEAIAVLTGQLHGARPEAGDVERDPRLEAHVLLLANQHLDGTREAVAGVVHRLPAEQAAHHPQVLRVLGDAHGRLPHAAGGGIAGAHPQVHAARRESIERGHGRHVHRRDTRAADGHAGTQPDPSGLLGGQGQHRVAVREQHLAVGDPDRIVAESLGVAEEADLVDVCHHADGEAHVGSLPVVVAQVLSRSDSSTWRARSISLCSGAGDRPGPLF